ncbi:hypothetical protein MHBO_004047 [Bonamia ostreae]|uniref:Uncharacterized protein n=1 Tax=Bonamia ostreae TaxID=126728 RepID=A0ABV2AS90_9EUKA
MRFRLLECHFNSEYETIEIPQNLKCFSDSKIDGAQNDGEETGLEIQQKKVQSLFAENIPPKLIDRTADFEKRMETVFAHCQKCFLMKERLKKRHSREKENLPKTKKSNGIFGFKMTKAERLKTVKVDENLAIRFAKQMEKYGNLRENRDAKTDQNLSGKQILEEIALQTSFYRFQRKVFEKTVFAAPFDELSEAQKFKVFEKFEPFSFIWSTLYESWLKNASGVRKSERIGFLQYFFEFLKFLVIWILISVIDWIYFYIIYI